MREHVVAKRYGKALFDAAHESGRLDAVAEDAVKIREAAVLIPAFVKGLSDERVEFKKRIGALESIALAIGIGEEMKNLLKLLMERKKIRITALVMDDFLSRVDRSKNLATMSASVAEPAIAEKVKESIAKIAGAVLKSDVKCDVDIDAALIGGFTVRIGDVFYDASIRGKIERMKEKMLD